MMNAIQTDRTPNFYFMQYELATWRVKNLLFVPSFAFPPSAIIKRKPVALTARRAGWIGCNIALNRVPVEARISVVTESKVSPEKEVREQFRRVKPLKDISVAQRGWTLDVLNIVRRIVSEGRALRDPNFSGQPGRWGVVELRPPTASQPLIPQCGTFTRELEQLHPDNRHVRDNPVNNTVTRGRNSPTTSSAARHRPAASRRARCLASAVTHRSPPGHRAEIIFKRHPPPQPVAGIRRKARNRR
jgi:hypothetical protein